MCQTHYQSCAWRAYNVTKVGLEPSSPAFRPKLPLPAPASHVSDIRSVTCLTHLQLLGSYVHHSTSATSRPGAFLTGRLTGAAPVSHAVKCTEFALSSPGCRLQGPDVHCLHLVVDCKAPPSQPQPPHLTSLPLLEAAPAGSGVEGLVVDCNAPQSRPQPLTPPLSKLLLLEVAAAGVEGPVADYKVLSSHGRGLQGAVFTWL